MKLSSVLDAMTYRDCFLEALPSVYLPALDCPLSKKGIQAYLECLEMNSVPVLTREDIEKFPFDIPKTFFNEAQYCVYLFENAILVNKELTYQNVSTYFGFDANMTPDCTYMVLMLYKINPKAGLFSGLKNKGQTHCSEIQKKTALHMVLKQVEGPSAKPPFSQELISHIRQITGAYMFSRFVIKTMVARMEDLLELGKSNETVRRMTADLIPSAMKPMITKHG